MTPYGALDEDGDLHNLYWIPYGSEYLQHTEKNKTLVCISYWIIPQKYISDLKS